MTTSMFPSRCRVAQYRSRPLLLEHQDSYSVNTCKAFYMRNFKRARIIPFGVVFHKRWNLAQNAFKKIDIRHSTNLQSITFEVNRAAYTGFAVFHQQLEASQGVLATASHSGGFSWNYSIACAARSLGTVSSSTPGRCSATCVNLDGSRCRGRSQQTHGQPCRCASKSQHVDACFVL